MRGCEVYKKGKLIAKNAKRKSYGGVAVVTVYGL